MQQHSQYSTSSRAHHHDHNLNRSTGSSGATQEMMESQDEMAACSYSGMGQSATATITSSPSGQQDSSSGQHYLGISGV